MKLRELLELLQSEPPENLDRELKVWLPGSTISLNHRGTLIARGTGVLMIEGNIDPGSVLYD